MADFSPFNGIVYSDSANLSAFIAPPYDVIDEAEKENLKALSPTNIVRLILPDDAKGKDRYTAAAELLDNLLEKGVLNTQQKPAFYVLEQDFEANGRRLVRRAVFGALKLSPFGEGKVLPHEYTLSGPKEDRLKLFRATKANLSPVFGLVPDENSAVAEWTQRAAQSCAAATASDKHGVVNHFMAVTDPVMTNELTNLIKEQVVLIADGHHRYETSLNYRNELGATGDGTHPADYVMIALVSMKDKGLVILPTHRVIHDTGRSKGLLERIRKAFDVHPATRRGLEELARDEKHEEIGVMGYVGPEGEYVISLRDAAVVDNCYPDKGYAYKALDVAILHGPILEKEMGIDAEKLAKKANITYVKTVDAVYEAIKDNKNECAFILRPTLMSEVLSVSKAGDRMPQKSTFFYPKLPTGLVMRKLTKEA